jgi:hypothetical protein
MTQEIKKQETSGAAVPRYWDPFAEMRAEMDRVFKSFLGRGLIGRPSPAADDDAGDCYTRRRCSRE